MKPEESRFRLWRHAYFSAEEIRRSAENGTVDPRTLVGQLLALEEAFRSGRCDDPSEDFESFVLLRFLAAIRGALERDFGKAERRAL